MNKFPKTLKEVNILNIRNGDILIMKFDKELEKEDAQNAVRIVQKVLNKQRIENVEVLVISENVELEVVRKSNKDIEKCAKPATKLSPPSSEAMD